MKFNFTDKDSANDAFLALIHSPEIRKSRRAKLHRLFDQFQKNEEDLFWSQRAVQVSTMVTTNETAIAAQRAGSTKAILEYERYGTDLDSLSAENQLIDDSDDSESCTEPKSPDTGLSSSVSRDPLEVDDAVEDVEQVLLTPMKATPFYSLIQYAFEKVQGKDVDLPPVPESFSSSNYRELFIYARNGLAGAAKPASSDKHRKTSKRQAEFTIDKDVLVALSGIVNTLSPSALRTFTIAPTIKSDSILPALSYKEPVATKLLSDLVAALCPELEADPYADPSIWSLQGKVWKLLADIGEGNMQTMEQRTTLVVLLIVNHLCVLISTYQLALPSSEHVYVSLWAFVFGTLFGGKALRAIP
ncbi:hypothetical protein BGW41_007679 [Actinomortierella wolfii]|nr:hypothetical protein BGW41_007679 [Actinomortierella wolfii]